MYNFNCDFCDKKFESKANSKRGHHFCCLSCYHKWLKYGNGGSKKTWFKHGHDGYFKGKKFTEEHKRRISASHSRKSNPTGENAQNWHGGKIIRSGYISIYRPEHLWSNKQGYVKEHRLVVEGIIGRVLEPTEVVHHIDENRKNNAPNNLILFKNDKEHQKHHQEIKRGRK